MKSPKIKTSSLFTIKKNETKISNVKLAKSKDSEAYIRQFFHEDIGIYESCFVVLLNRANTTIGYAKISQGGIAGTIVDIRIILKYAVDTLASGIILCHNHPSGVLKPSQSDRDLTRQLKEAARLFEIQLLDHIIITEDNFLSFADEGLL